MDLRSLNLAWPIRFGSSARIRLFFSPPKPNSISSLRPFKTSIFPLSSSLTPHLTPHSSPERGDMSSWSSDVAGSVPREKLLQVVLVSPQIPGNTGCIARTCAASAIGLHLVEPLGFQVDDTKLKRAGLDYWPFILLRTLTAENKMGVLSDCLTRLETRPSIWMLKQSQAISSSSNCYQYDSKPERTVHGSWMEFREYFRQKEGEKRLLAFTKRGTAIHSDFSYKRGDWLVFGSETCGLPHEALVDCNNESLGGGTIRIPMVETYVRCLNLSVSVGIAAYEASRQLNYEQLRSQPKACVDSENSFVSEDIYA